MDPHVSSTDVLSDCDNVTSNGYNGMMNQRRITPSRIAIPPNPACQYSQPAFSTHPGINYAPIPGINYDHEPQIMKRKPNGKVVYKQEVAIRYLKPPTPPPPGPLIIKEVRAEQRPPAPPLVIRQRPPHPPTPPPMIIRESPPSPPAKCNTKMITRTLPAPPPPPRRVIIERLPPLPPKPRSIIVERWLGYTPVKRKVIYQRAPPIIPPTPQRNLIIQWEGAEADVQKEYKNLGVFRADPETYRQKFGGDLKLTEELPAFVKEFRPPEDGAPNQNSEADFTFNPEQCSYASVTDNEPMTDEDLTESVEISTAFRENGSSQL